MASSALYLAHELSRHADEEIISGFLARRDSQGSWKLRISIIREAAWKADPRKFILVCFDPLFISSRYPRHQNDYMQLFVFGNYFTEHYNYNYVFESLAEIILEKYSSSCGKPSDYNSILEFQEEFILQTLHLQLNFSSVRNISCNHFGADSKPALYCARNPPERSSCEIFRRARRKMRRNFGEIFRRFSSFNFQGKWPQKNSRKILDIFHGATN